MYFHSCCLAFKQIQQRQFEDFTISSKKSGISKFFLSSNAQNHHLPLSFWISYRVGLKERKKQSISKNKDKTKWKPFQWFTKNKLKSHFDYFSGLWSHQLSSCSCLGSCFEMREWVRTRLLDWIRMNKAASRAENNENRFWDDSGTRVDSLVGFLCQMGSKNEQIDSFVTFVESVKGMNPSIVVQISVKPP